MEQQITALPTAEGSEPSASTRLVILDASLKRLRPAQRALAMGERRALYAEVTGLDPRSAKFAQQHLHDAMEKTGLGRRAVEYDLEIYDRVDHAVLVRLTEDSARRANKIAVLLELKDLDQQAERAEEHIAAPARQKAKRKRGSMFEELVRVYRSFDNQESVQLHDAARFAEFLAGELGGAA